ncbi:hypothetical protein MMC25_006392 [Agyrium rufum]|nr:hypothetical protein [Agyrium rufum]
MPSYFAKTGYMNPADGVDGPFQYAHHTKMHGFAWITQPENEEMLRNFNQYISGTHDGQADWLDWFPIRENIMHGLNRNDEGTTMVDVGGALGHELVRLKDKFADLPGLLILQDLAETIKMVPETTVFEATVHNFFEPQVVQGARVYYFRSVLHDWPDKQAKIILENTVSAMKKGYSKILINEMVVSDVGAGWTETQWDLLM